MLPTHNRAYVLWRAILSVQAQTVADWELIVVDDGSTDCTSRMLEEFGDPRIRSIRTDRSGPSAARNIAVSESRYDTIAYIDSDNRWAPAFLEVMLNAARRNQGRLWYCGQLHTEWERTADGVWMKIAERENRRRQYTTLEALNLKGPDTNCMLHEKSAWEAVGGWDGRCSGLEDWDFFTRVMLTDPSGVHWVDEVLVHYRQVFGDGADSLCGEAREDRHGEIARRRYLLDKWPDRQAEAAGEGGRSDHHARGGIGILLRN